MRYGIDWPDGTCTGAITDSYRLAAAYAAQHGGKVRDDKPKTTAKDEEEQHEPE
jgi:hypothetical protein